LSSIRPANHHRAKPAGDSPGQPLNRLFERHRISERFRERAEQLAAVALIGLGGYLITERLLTQ
jgi:hypothetical protein